MKTGGADAFDSTLVFFHGSRGIAHRITHTRSKVTDMNGRLNSRSKRYNLRASGVKIGDWLLLAAPGDYDTIQNVETGRNGATVTDITSVISVSGVD
jgi:hypothetical protein